MNTTPLKDWQIAEIRRVLGAQRSKKNGGKFAMSINLYIEFEQSDLHCPSNILRQVNHLIGDELIGYAAHCGEIVKSATRAEWEAKRQQLRRS